MSKYFLKELHEINGPILDGKLTSYLAFIRHRIFFRRLFVDVSKKSYYVLRIDPIICNKKLTSRITPQPIIGPIFNEESAHSTYQLGHDDLISDDVAPTIYDCVEAYCT